jgi:hypothetical protein
MCQPQRLARKLKENTIPAISDKKFTTISYEVGLKMLGVAENLRKYPVHVHKRKKKESLPLQAAQTTNDQNLVSKNFRD